MSTTPRTDAAKEQYLTGKMGIYGVLNEACQLETELNAMKAEFEKIILLAAQAADRNVELRRLAEKAEAELARLRADLERFTGGGLLDCHAICDQRDSAVSERDQLRAEVERLDAENNKLNAETNNQSFRLGEATRGMEWQPAYKELKARAEKAEAELASLGAELERQTRRAFYFEKQLAEPANASAEKAEAECLEQARLLGMSASREASLLGKISQLERQLEKNNS